MTTRTRYQPRNSTEPEPSNIDLIFAAVFLLMLIGCFVALWSEVAAEFCRQVVLMLARSH
jgi:hypothetical protein